MGKRPKDKQRIGVILPEAERWSSHFGGALARYMYEVIVNAPTDRFDITVYSTSCNTEYAYKYPIQKPRFGRFTLWLDRIFTKLHTGFAGWFYILSFYPKLKKNELIHVFNRPFYALILRKLGYKGKIIIHLQNDFYLSSVDYAKAFIKSADLVISCSEKIADRLFEKDPENKHKSKVIYNGADPEKFTFVPFEGRKKQLLYVGRIDPIKGVHNLLDAYAEVAKEFPDWKLVLAGSAGFGGRNKLTPYEEQIKAKINTINHAGGQIEHLGYVNHAKLPELFQESQLFCLPSVVHEAFGIVIVEAIFCGTPVVCSNLGGMPEAVGPYGVLCNPNAGDLKKGILAYLRVPEKMIADSTAGLKRAQEMFSWKAIAQEQYKTYQHVLNG
jgi:glycosyltransferase involved in cell wall biosynthesis